MKVYPNPIKNKFFFQANSTIGIIEIFDARDVCFYKNFCNENVFDINVQNWSSGIYWIKCNNIAKTMSIIIE